MDIQQLNWIDLDQCGSALVGVDRVIGEYGGLNTQWFDWMDLDQC